MILLPLGNSGLKVSRLSLGCMSYGSSQARPWILDEEAALPFYRQAIDVGINFFDTADLYSQGKSEEVTGRALKKLGVRRGKGVIWSKIFFSTATNPKEQGTPKKKNPHPTEAKLWRPGVEPTQLFPNPPYQRSTPMEETLGG